MRVDALSGNNQKQKPSGVVASIPTIANDTVLIAFNPFVPVAVVIVIVLLPLIGFAKQGHAVTPSSYTAILLLSCGEHYTNIWWCAPHYYIA